MARNIHETLQRLLALTESPIEAEAQLAAEKLQHLLEKHNLHMADLERRGQDKPGVRQSQHDLGKAAFKWKLNLADRLATHFYCYPIINDCGSVKSTVAFVGRPDNVDTMHMLYGWIIDQIKRIATDERRVHTERTGEHIDGLRWQVAFGEGAVRRLDERLTEMRERQATEAGTALAVSHKSEVSDYLEERYGYRVDGKKTAAQRRRDEEWEANREEREARWAKIKANKAKLLEEDPEEYYRQYPYEDPKYIAKEEARERRNARARERRRERRSWSPGRSRPESASTVRKRREQQTARVSGYESADSVNLQPFLDGSTDSEDRLKA